MSQKSLAVWLKIIIAGLAVLLLLFAVLIVPMLGQSTISYAPEFSGWFVPWLIFAWVTAVPCFIAAVFAWKVADNIGKDRSFSIDNALLLKRIAILAAADGAILFTGDLVLSLLSMSHPGITLGLLLLVFLAVAASVACAALSHLVRKAADLQQESDLTI